MNVMARAACGIATLLLSMSAHAASISVVFDSTTVAPGSTLNVTISGAEFTETSRGGDFSATWDPAVLEYTGTTIDSIWDNSAVDDSTSPSGTLDRVDVLKFVGDAVGPEFSIATIAFNVIGPAGSSSIFQLAEAPPPFGVGWSFPDNPLETYEVDYGSATVNVVPVPAAVWLFASALGLLGWSRRRAR